MEMEALALRRGTDMYYERRKAECLSSGMFCWVEVEARTCKISFVIISIFSTKLFQVSFFI